MHAWAKRKRKDNSLREAVIYRGGQLIDIIDLAAWSSLKSDGISLVLEDARDVLQLLHMCSHNGTLTVWGREGKGRDMRSHSQHRSRTGRQ